MSSILLDFPFDFPEPADSLLIGIAAVANFQIQGLGCVTTMPHASLVPFQVFSAILAICFFFIFVVLEWLIVRFAQKAEKDSSFSEYILKTTEYNLISGECCA
jgi:hypothetical protein